MPLSFLSIILDWMCFIVTQKYLNGKHDFFFIAEMKLYSLYAFSSLLNFLVSLFYKKKLYVQTFLLNKGLSKLTRINTIIWIKHREDWFPVLWLAYSASTDRWWYHIVMCYNNSEPHEGRLYLLKDSGGKMIWIHLP